MKKWALYFLAVLALVVITQSAALTAYDPPHDDANNIFCADCHGASLDIAGGSPFWTDNTADSAYNAVCLRCHIQENPPYTKTAAPLAASHSPGTTLIKCTICHDNHEQDMVNRGRYNQNALFIAKGTADSVQVDVPSAGLTTINFAVPAGLWATDPSSDWAFDLDNLGAKTNNERGAMLVPSISLPRRWPVFMIDSIDAAAGKIIVKGDASTAADFGIVYGQLLSSVIRYNGTKFVEFYDNQGTYGWVNPATGKGICQVCHTSTGHFRSTPDGARDNHNANSNCMTCHKHSDVTNGGFAPSADHEPDGIVDYSSPADTSCGICHYGDVISGADTHAGDCSLCHVPADNNRLRTVAEIEAGGARVGKVTQMDDNGTLGGTDGGGNCTTCHFSHLSTTASPPAWYFHVVDHTAMGWVTPNTDTSSNTVNCTGCHDANGILTGVHDLSGTASTQVTCNKCHFDGPATKDLRGSALANGNFNGPLPQHEDHSVSPVNECATCHINHFDGHDHGTAGGIEHDITFTPAVDKNVDNTLCSACHGTDGGDALTGTLDSWDEIYTLHQSDCSVCHDYGAATTDTPPIADVYANIPGTGVTCVSCHTPKAGPEFHGGHDATHFGFDAECVACHQFPPLGGPEVVADVHANDCNVCHSGSPQTRDNEKEGDPANGIDGDARLANGAAAAGFNPATYTCKTCHPGAISGDLAYASIHHDSKNNMATGGDCTSKCHVGGTPKGGNHIATVSLATNCALCHTGTEGYASGKGMPTDQADNKKHDLCTTCHTIDTGDNYYAKLTGSASGKNGTTIGGTDGGGDCETCHNGFDDNHAAVDHDPMVDLAVNCDDCHTGTQAPTPGPVPLDTGDNKVHDTCSNCHDVDGSLTGSAAGEIGSGVGGTDGGGDCQTCHSAFDNNHLALDHDPMVDLAVNCDDCHTGTQAPTPGPVPLDTGDNKVHDTCSNCHDVDGSLTGSASGKIGSGVGGTDGGGNCQTCHSAFDNNHLTLDHDPMVDLAVNCDDCHTGTQAPTPGPVPLDTGDNKVHDTCSNCHDVDGSLTGSAAGEIGSGVGGTDGGGDCQTCHNGFVNNHLTLDHDPMVDADADTSAKNDCIDCHTETAAPTPGPVPLDSGSGKEADKKHDSCSACHDADGTLTGSAAGNEGLNGVGGTDGGGDCTACHGAYFDSHTHGNAGNHVVSYSAIPADDLSQDGTVPNDYCAACHNDYTSTTASLNTWLGILYEHDLDGTKNGSGACSTCHDYSGASTAQGTPPPATNDSLIANNTTSTCTTCHTPKDFNANPSTSEHGGHPVDFSNTANCSPCHNSVAAGGVLKGIHGDGTTATCSICHSGTPTRDNEKTTTIGDANQADGISASDPGDGSHWAAVNCETCHNTTDASAFHGYLIADVASSHQLSSDSSGGYDCEACHSSDAGNEQLTTHGATTAALCASVCHYNTTASVPTGKVAKTVIDTAVAASAAVNCEQCHAAKGDYKRHGLADDSGADGAVDKHNNLSVSTNAGSGTETDCAACHSISSVLTRLQMHTQPLSGDTNDCLTCHTATGAAVTAINNGKGAGSAQTCENCHTAKGVYTRHGLTSGTGGDGVSDVHDSFAASTNAGSGTETDCGECHVAGTATQRIDLHANCLACHNAADDVTAPGTGSASTVIAAGWSVPTTANCESCHTAKGAYLRHGLTDDDGADKVHDVHDQLSNSSSGYPVAETDCENCHAASAVLSRLQTHTQPVSGASNTCLTCHGASAGTTALTAISNGVGGSAQYCDTCHAAKGDYTLHGLTIANVADVHNKFIDSTNTGEKDCANCHITTTVANRLDLHPLCLTCHDPDNTTYVSPTPTTSGSTAPSVVNAGRSTGGNADQSCENCHSVKGNYEMHGLESDDSNGDTVANVHENLADSIGSGTITYNNTDIMLTDSEYFCSDCHITTTVSDRLSAHLNCLACHFAADHTTGTSWMSVIKSGRSKLGHLDGGVGGSTTIECEDCHTSTYDGDTDSGEKMYQYDGIRHHKLEWAQAGDCTYCHADPRPDASGLITAGDNNGPGWAGTAENVDGGNDGDTAWPTGASGVTPGSWDAGVDVIPPKQVGCRQCHVESTGTGLVVYHNDYSDKHTSGTVVYDNNNNYDSTTNLLNTDTGWALNGNEPKVAQTSMDGSSSVTVKDPDWGSAVTYTPTNHNISGTAKINVYNYGACLSCHSIEVWHAKPKYAEIPQDEKTSTRAGYNFHYDVLREAPGRHFFGIWRGGAPGNNAFRSSEPYYSHQDQTYDADPGIQRNRAKNGMKDWSNDGADDGCGTRNDKRQGLTDCGGDWTTPGVGWYDGSRRVTFSRYLIPLDSLINDRSAYARTTMSSASGDDERRIIRFTDITAPEVDYITITSAVWDGSTLTVAWTSSLGASQTFSLSYSGDGTCSFSTNDLGGGSYDSTCTTSLYSNPGVETVTVENTSAADGGSQAASVVNNNIPVNAVADSYTITSAIYTTTLSVMSNDTGVGIYVSAVDDANLNANCTATINADAYVGVDVNCTGTGTGDWGSFDYTITGANSDTSTATVSIARANASPALSISQPSGDTDVPGSYDITYTLDDIEETVTVDFYYDTTGSGFSTTNAIGTCQNQAEGTDATCTWNTSALADNTYYVWGEADDGVNAAVQVYAAGSLDIVSNVSPTATNDGSVGTPYTTVGSGVTQITGLLANDSDGGDGGALTIATVTNLTCDAGSGASVAINADNVSVDFTAPDADASCSFDYTISDTFSTSTAATVYVDVVLCTDVSVMTGKDWSNECSWSGTDNNWVCNSAANYTINAGSDRLLVVAVMVELAAGTNITFPNVQWNNVDMTEVPGTRTNGDQMTGAMFYLNEAGISGAADNNGIVEVTVDDNFNFDLRSIHTYAITFENVDQTTLFADAQENYVQNTTAIFSLPSISYGLNDKLIVVGGNESTVANLEGPSVATTGYTDATRVSDGMRTIASIKDSTSPAGSDTPDFDKNSTNNYRTYVMGVTVQSVCNGQQ